MTMDGLQPVLVMLLLASAITAVVTAVAERVTEHAHRTKLLRRLSSAGATTQGDSTAPAEIIRQSSKQAGRWLNVLRRAPFFRGSGPMLEQAGLDWSGATFARLTSGCGAAVGIVAFLILKSTTGAMVGVGLGMMLPTLYVRRRRRKRLAAIEEQLAEAIDLLTRAIRAGHALTTALRMVADESADPLASEFRRVFDEQKYGMRFEESLRGMTRRVELADVRVMVIAILVQREVGGNLAEILDNIGQLIRNRFTLRRQVQVYTAQGRMSGWVLGGLPIALGGVIYLMNPDYIGLLFTDPAGRAMLAAGVALQMIGYFWISRILKLDY
jgi:tight adherence protein B